MEDAVTTTFIDGDEVKKATLHMTLWKADRTYIDQAEAAGIVSNCASGAISEVEVESNILQSLINVITIGLYKPVTVRYKCAKCKS